MNPTVSTPRDNNTGIDIDIDISVDSARTRVASVCRDLYHHSWMPGTSGNVSVRCGDVVVISASGRAKGAVSRRDTVVVSTADGLAVAGETERPSAETVIHLAVYAAVPEAGAVVHAHAPYSTSLASRAHVSGDDVVFTDWELAKGLGVPDPSTVTIPVFANWPDVPRIAADVTGRLGPADAPALLIARHGATVWGRDLTEAVNRLECVEMLSRLELLEEDKL